MFQSAFAAYNLKALSRASVCHNGFIHSSGCGIGAGSGVARNPYARTDT